jgi:hypothetical protein
MDEPEVTDINDLSAYIARRRAELGMTDHDDWLMRNSGENRTPEKRELLRRIAERCRAAGIEPSLANV